ncbi:carbohydrate ABC transporter permease [Paenibacillus sp. GCM10023248]|uniref:carbohydrate ABC transporter permease n=1 Tax=Bacillales TaxID=1385 RepID=UPI0023781798|nr:MULTISPECIES: sugar ABC transporter permease [Bacillales]MDD9266578.1 sugar ABC transporter permease [Paenibacillus sp. MAHUQ-63]MDR6878706.1 raffinose/stachyose/melibiose transport system permease protein [Bacillus sp. 3255]
MGKHTYPLYFSFPALAVFLLFFITPTLIGFYYSFTDWNINAESIQFTGLANYIELFQEPRLKTALINTLIFAIVVTLMQNFLGLGLALILNEALKLRNLLRTIFFLPYVIAPIVIGYIFRAIYHPEHGIVNTLLSGIGLQSLVHDWLNDPKYALFSIIVTDLWRVAGFSMVVYLAGLQFIPKDLIESSSMDGARYWQRFRSVVFPLLAPALTVNVLLSMIGSMKVFEMVMVLTEGGPGYTTEVFYTYIRSMFSTGLFGYATAVNVVLFVLVTIVGVPVLMAMKKREVEM